MKTSDFDYYLPPELIAQAPIRPRDHSRLMIMHRNTGLLEHASFYQLKNWLRPGDLLVINTSKVFKARLQGRISATNSPVEIFLLRPEKREWLALAKPGKRLERTSDITFPDGRTAQVTAKHPDGTIRLDFHTDPETILAWTDTIGSIPVPPYVQHTPENNKEYQTTYADRVGSVAAPTAGFHFTPSLIEDLKMQGIRFASLTLHVGLGTFRPIKSETLEEHRMHSEWIEVSTQTRQAIQETKTRGHRVIAVGTTTVRALESDIDQGFTNIFITPGYTFKYIDGLITNFHLPKSTLLVLISAFAGRDRIMNAYKEAIAQKYRFYSFGDAMLIL